MRRREDGRSKWLMGNGNCARRGKKKKEKGRGCGRHQRGNSSEMSRRRRAEYREETQETQREGVKERIEKEGLIVNGRVALKNPKMYVGINERREERAQTRRSRFFFFFYDLAEEKQEAPVSAETQPLSCVLLLSIHSLQPRVDSVMQTACKKIK